MPTQLSAGSRSLSKSQLCHTHTHMHEQSAPCQQHRQSAQPLVLACGTSVAHFVLVVHFCKVKLTIQEAESSYRKRISSQSNISFLSESMCHIFLSREQIQEPLKSDVYNSRIDMAKMKVSQRLFLPCTYPVFTWQKRGCVCPEAQMEQIINCIELKKTCLTFNQRTLSPRHSLPL